MSGNLRSEPSMPIARAVEVCFPHGGIKPATLMAAIRRGELAYEKIGRAYFVTETDVTEWRKQCRVPQKVTASISGKEKAENRNTSSVTERMKYSRDSVRLKSQKLKKGLRNISAPGDQIPANVISIRSQLEKS